MVTALASEHMEASCDIGRPASRLRAAFPEVDFGELPEVWWYVPDGHEGITEEESHRLFKEEGRREGRAAFERRVECFARWLEQRPEKAMVIAIFAHADFFNCFLHKFFGDQAAKFQDYWMKNCELLELSFTTLTPKAPPVKAQRPSVSEVHPAHPPHANHHHHQAGKGSVSEFYRLRARHLSGVPLGSNHCPPEQWHEAGTCVYSDAPCRCQESNGS
ncbi:unnamed protein product [Effrenium voratum]|nr:unnamed protein product [Effrenium voratum]